MSVSPAYSLLYLPDDVLNLIPLYLGKDIGKYRILSKKLKGVSEAAFEALKNQLFIERYGARSESETNLPIDVLISRVQSIRTIHEMLRLEDFVSGSILDLGGNPDFNRYIISVKHLWLNINHGYVPQLVDYKAWFFSKKNSLFQVLKARYKFFTQDFHQERNQKINTLIDFQDKVESELVSQPLNLHHPLQDLCNRCRRLQTLQEERESISLALEAERGSAGDFLSKLSSIEKVSFRIIAWVHSWFRKSLPPLKSLNPTRSLVSWNSKEVTFKETKIIFQGIEVPVVIKAKYGILEYKAFSLTTNFFIYQIYKKGRQVLLGSFSIERLREQIGQDASSVLDYSDNSRNLWKGVDSHRKSKLHIPFFKDCLGQDATNGDRPIMRLLIQIAVEIFRAETDNKIEIRISDCDAAVFIAGGFSTNQTSINSSIQEKITKARVNGWLLPVFQRAEDQERLVHLEKSSHPLSTLFVTRDKEGREQEAMVAFGLEYNPLTWEDQIEKLRLLPTHGPILPKFYIQDFFRFVKFKTALKVKTTERLKTAELERALEAERAIFHGYS